MSPEIRGIFDKAHAEMAPLFMELRAKKQELVAKIYSGADDSVTKGIVAEINSLQSRLTEAGAELNKHLAKAGVPLNPGMMQCPVLGSGYHGRGPGGPGGPGFHGMGGCAYLMNMAPSADAKNN